MILFVSINSSYQDVEKDQSISVVNDVIDIDVGSLTSLCLQDLDSSQVLLDLVIIFFALLNSNEDFVFKVMLLLQQFVYDLDLCVVCSSSII